MSELIICEKRTLIVETAGHLLIEGGPGSGKTTIALLKARRLISDGGLMANQRILFLSFARATIARVEEHAKKFLEQQDSRHIEINTYHGFTWSLIQNYGYLVSRKKTIRLITPPNAAALMAMIPVEERDDFQKNLYFEDGILCFDLFASIAAEILKKSGRIRDMISDKYPIIIVDEFQDTNATEWELIKQLGIKSKIVALADLQQRIYDFRGASITRIPEFNSHFSSTRFDLGKDNHRSGSTDIATFGDDLLTGQNIGKSYKQVIINKYKQNFQDGYAPLKYELINCIKRLKASVPDNKWSIAILVKSKQATLSLSNALSQGYKNIPRISHEVLIDPAGPALAATVIACLLEPFNSVEECANTLLLFIINHIRGRKGDGPSKADIGLIDALEEYKSSGKIRGAKRILLTNEIIALVTKRNSLILTGSPAEDWIAIRKLFGEATHEALKNVYGDALYLRLLNRGAILNQDLSEQWRNFQCYQHAVATIESALLQEHFAMATRPWTGIFIMTMHKAKGKEFDEVIIWEDKFRTIVQPEASEQDIERAKLALRVAVTRAKSRTTILTCKDKPCQLL